MDVNYRRDYDQIKQQYKGTLTLEGKKITKQWLEVEISTKENNITTYDKEAANKETTLVFGTITLLLAIVSFTKDILPNGNVFEEITKWPTTTPQRLNSIWRERGRNDRHEWN